MTATALPRAAPLPSGAVPAERLVAGRRVDGLDGLRAVAVVTVLVIHAFPRGRFPGAVGVDVFFVLSGYLITSLLLAERARHGDVSLWRFYARRFLRLVPPLLLFLVVLAPLGRSFVGDVYLQRAVYAAELRANLVLSVQHVSMTPLEHTWSLGQEAQFYLVWPLVLVALLRLRVPRALLAAGCLAGALVCFAALHAVEVAAVRPVDDFRLDVRSGGLLVGCALALVLSLRRGLLARRGLPEAALLGLLTMYAWALLVAPVPLWVAVPVAVVASALVLGALLGGAGGPVARLLALPGPVFLGRVSYSFYLWHYPFFRTLQRDPDLPAAVVLLLEVVLSLAAAGMSYTVVEQPLARWSARRLHRAAVA